MTAALSVSRSGKPFWDPASRTFAAAAFRGAMVARGWTVVEFARVAGVSNACLYNALRSRAVSDRTAIRIFAALDQREPRAAAWLAVVDAMPPPSSAAAPPTVRTCGVHHAQ